MHSVEFSVTLIHEDVVFGYPYALFFLLAAIGKPAKCAITPKELGIFTHKALTNLAQGVGLKVTQPLLAFEIAVITFANSIKSKVATFNCCCHNNPLAVVR